jgi:hypothetical protein
MGMAEHILDLVRPVALLVIVELVDLAQLSESMNINVIFSSDGSLAGLYFQQYSDILMNRGSRLDSGWLRARVGTPLECLLKFGPPLYRNKTDNNIHSEET